MLQHVLSVNSCSLPFTTRSTAFTCLGFIAWLCAATINFCMVSCLPADILLLDIRTYRLSQNVKPLIWVECLVERHSRSRTEYMVKARSQFKERSSATNVEILLPLPPDAITPNVRTSQVSFTAIPSTGAPCACWAHHEGDILIDCKWQASQPEYSQPCRVQQYMLLKRKQWCGRSRTFQVERSFC